MEIEKWMISNNQWREDKETVLLSYKNRTIEPSLCLPSYIKPELALEIITSTMGDFYGYTPADAAQDLKSAIGTVLLKYNGSIKTITNYPEFWKIGVWLWKTK